MMKTHEQFADDLALYALGELDGSDVQEMQEHVQSCAACRRELQALRGDLGLLGLSSQRASASGAEQRAADERDRSRAARSFAG